MSCWLTVSRSLSFQFSSLSNSRTSSSQFVYNYVSVDNNVYDQRMRNDVMTYTLLIIVIVICKTFSDFGRPRTALSSF